MFWNTPAKLRNDPLDPGPEAPSSSAGGQDEGTFANSLKLPTVSLIPLVVLAQHYACGMHALRSHALMQARRFCGKKEVDEEDEQANGQGWCGWKWSHWFGFV